MRCRRRNRMEYEEGQGIDTGRMQSKRTNMPVRSTAYRTQQTHITRPCPHDGDNDEVYFESLALSPSPPARYRKEVDGELNYWYGSKHGTPPYSRQISLDNWYEATDAAGEEYGADDGMRQARDHGGKLSRRVQLSLCDQYLIRLGGLAARRHIYALVHRVRKMAGKARPDTIKSARAYLISRPPVPLTMSRSMSVTKLNGAIRWKTTYDTDLSRRQTRISLFIEPGTVRRPRTNLA